jgi:peptidoglycan/xylan/chitin deacetylase (PgdA/CDA1 family)
MVSLKLRLIREQNRIYTFILQLLSALKNGPIVYLFHDIVVNKEDVKTQFAISQDSFEKFLLKKIESGHQPLTFYELTNTIEGNIKKKHNAFYVSFDDCNESVFTHAFPFLKKHNIPFILFITKDLIGKKNYLTFEQIMQLAKDPICIIGSHALHHNMFRYMTEQEARTEFEKSRSYLQQLTGQSIDCFAFPYGRLVEVSCQNIKILSQSEYKFAFSAVAGNLHQKWLSGKYYLPRVNVSEEVVGSKQCALRNKKWA